MDILNNIKSFYSKNKTVVLNKAITSLREEIATNPNNINATQLLADMLLEQGKVAEARDILEKLYQFQPQAAQSRLIKTLLILAKQTDNENEQIKVYQQIFKLDAKQQEAINAWQKIWQRRGDDARKAGDLETALAHYRTAHFEEDVKTPTKKPIPTKKTNSS
jgi:tetratricopeptide (TPR) repeat protein